MISRNCSRISAVSRRSYSMSLGIRRFNLSSASCVDVVSSQSYGPSFPTRCLSSSSASSCGLTFLFSFRPKAAIKHRRTTAAIGPAKNHFQECRADANTRPGTTRKVARKIVSAMRPRIAKLSHACPCSSCTRSKRDRPSQRRFTDLAPAENLTLGDAR